MTIPRYPSHFFSRPFASEGTYRIVEDEKPASGRASLKEGFPEETQNPLGYGGVAPNRMDFNGILNMMTSMLCWMQSGGMWQYSTTLSYAPPAIVKHGDVYWSCKAENGPSSAMGVVEPGSNEDVWEEFLLSMVNVSSKDVGGVPVGTIITYYGDTPPEGYFGCDGSTFSPTNHPLLFSLLGSAILPDLRGQFLRGYDPGIAAYVEGAEFDGHLSDFTAISNGGFRATFGGKAVVVSALNFTEAESLDDVCLIIENAINALANTAYTVSYQDSRFVISSVYRGTAYAVSAMLAPTTGTNLLPLLKLSPEDEPVNYVGVNPVADPEGGQRSIGDNQFDTGRRLHGKFGSYSAGATRVFYNGGPDYVTERYKAGATTSNGTTLDTNRDVDGAWGKHSGVEFRPVNTAVLYCIRHD